MEEIYLFMLIALFGLAITDLVVGVSNDAVNFLNSAIGSKAIPIKTIMIVASVGVAVGAISSSGMMEVARKGIFNPEFFYFNEIIVIFMAVMITDILLLDLFNSMGLPTSTTVSIVFELLGSAVCIAIIKVYNNGEGFADLLTYINTGKATQIILGIVLSVLIAFTVGAIVQYISRLFFSFYFEKSITYLGGIFGGISMTAITYFILIKGLKSVTFIPASFLSWIDDNNLLFIGISLLVWTLLSQLLMSVFKLNILRVIIIVGTFALAMAFAGNDLVNFIGVPIAAWQSFELWSQSGVAPEQFSMEQLAGAVRTPSYLLFAAGLIMVVTLWFSKKARTVVETGINLSRQQEGAERFRPNFLSRLVVRASINLNGAFNIIIPKHLQQKINVRFTEPPAKKVKDTTAPAFDMVRASVNLVVASILIAIGTSLKLPLSTTYVTFMVAMGTSLADRAWGRESAVYRVAGVFNVIGGWFVTAIVAFLAAGTFACIIYYGGVTAVIALLALALLLLLRSFIVYRKAEKAKKNKQKFDRTDLITIREMLSESSDHIANVIQTINIIYNDVINGLGLQDLRRIRKGKRSLVKLDAEVDELKEDIFYFVKSLDDASVEASQFYILILDYLQDMVQSIGFFVKNGYNHVNNNHKKLKFNQIKDLKGIDNKLRILFNNIKQDFDNRSFDTIERTIQKKQELLDDVSSLIQKQINRIRSTETSPKNTKLYFTSLLETRDLIVATMNLLELFRTFQDDYKMIKSKR